eukprot:SAG31_NODE_15292_length_762_cov_0.876320_1_plen_160_part_01
MDDSDSPISEFAYLEQEICVIVLPPEVLPNACCRPYVRSQKNHVLAPPVLGESNFETQACAADVLVVGCSALSKAAASDLLCGIHPDPTAMKGRSASRRATGNKTTCVTALGDVMVYFSCSSLMQVHIVGSSSNRPLRAHCHTASSRNPSQASTRVVLTR